MFRFSASTFLLAWLACVAWADPPAPSAKDKPSRHTMQRAWQEALERAKRGFVGPTSPDAVRMAAALLKGETLGPGGGWFAPSKLRHDWAWLAERFDKDGDGRVVSSEFTFREYFARLDRDGDGAVTAEDLDWTEAAAFMKQQAQANRLFRAFDVDGNAQLSAEEWQARFKALAKGKDHLTADDLRAAFFPPAPPKAAQAKKGEKIPDVIRQAFLDGDAGSPFEGPRPGEPAPDFTLSTHDGKQRLTLSNHFGKRPIVLIFGSFT